MELRRIPVACPACERTKLAALTDARAPLGDTHRCRACRRRFVRWRHRWLPSGAWGRADVIWLTTSHVALTVADVGGREHVIAEDIAGPVARAALEGLATRGDEIRCAVLVRGLNKRWTAVVPALAVKGPSAASREAALAAARGLALAARRHPAWPAGPALLLIDADTLPWWCRHKMR